MKTKGVRDFHKNLADYFSVKQIFLANSINIRKVVEEPFQYLNSSQIENLHVFLTDFLFFRELFNHSQSEMLFYWRSIDEHYDPFRSYSDVWESWCKHGLSSWSGLYRSANNIGILLEKRGQFLQAGEFYHRSIETVIPYSGAFGISTLEININLGRVLHEENDLEKSSKILRDSLEKHTQKLGPSHIQTLKTVNELAKCCIKQNNRAEAKALYGWIINSIGLNTATKSLDSLLLIKDYAVFLIKENKFFEAEEIILNVLESLKNICNKKDSLLFEVKIELATIYLTQYKFADVVFILTESNEEIIKYLGINHPLTIRAKSLLSLATKQKKK